MTDALCLHIWLSVRDATEEPSSPYWCSYRTHDRPHIERYLGIKP